MSKDKLAQILLKSYLSLLFEHQLTQILFQSYQLTMTVSAPTCLDLIGILLMWWGCKELQLAHSLFQPYFSGETVCTYLLTSYIDLTYCSTTLQYCLRTNLLKSYFNLTFLNIISSLCIPLTA